MIYTKRVPLMFLPYFDIFRDLLVNRRTATWTLLYKLLQIKPQGPIQAVCLFMFEMQRNVWEDIEKS